MRTLVTGAAGFVGSHLTERLLADGHAVRAVDAFTDYYDPARKHDNLAAARRHPRCEVVHADVATADLRDLVDGIDVVLHQAAQPGVRTSWADGFAQYTDANVLATQRLLEAVSAAGVERLVYASSSSVYGAATSFPTRETDLPRPFSPYGVTKLAGEHLCNLYAANKGVSAVSLRYFTVYGPRQRPDMGLHRFVECALDGRPAPLYGTGEQVRDFTFVSDVVEANLLAAVTDLDPGTVMNVAGGASVSLLQLLRLLGEVVGSPVEIEHLPPQPGDVARTGASSRRLRAATGWRPRVPLADGLAAQVAWHRELRSGS